MLWIRKIIFYFFALIYLILCPLIIGRMLGYVFNPHTLQLEKTGLVYISTIPPGASITIDGHPAHDKTPTIIRDLTPGNHNIHIELQGYNAWHQDIPIIGRQATVLANTLLIPQAWPIKTVLSQSYEDFIIADDDILVATSALLKNIIILKTTLDLDIQESSPVKVGKNLFATKSIYADGQLMHLYHTALSPFILLQTMIKDKPKFLWIKLNENPPLIEDISDLFPEIPIHILWDNSDNSNIYAFYQLDVYRINVKDKAIYPQDPGKLPPRLYQRLPEKPQDQFLINDKNDLLNRDGRWIRLHPKEEFSSNQIYTIAQSKPSTNMYFEEKNGELFFLNAAGQLTVAQILPYHPIINIPIPDGIKAKFTKKDVNL